MEVPRFAAAIFNTAMEPTMVRVKTLDADLKKFLESVQQQQQQQQQEKQWNNTVVILTSEIGAWNTSYARETSAGRVEVAAIFLYLFITVTRQFLLLTRIQMRNPVLYVIPPRNFLQSHHSCTENLSMNQARLVSPIDLYTTLKHFITHPNTVPSAPHSGVSLLSAFSERSCTDAGIPDALCACEGRVRDPYVYIPSLPLSFSQLDSCGC
jgi:hypothetical protein